MVSTCNCLSFDFIGIKCQSGFYDFYISGSENGRPFYLGTIMSIEYKIYWDGTQWIFQQTDPSFPEVPFFSTIDTYDICELTGLDWQIGNNSTFPILCTTLVGLNVSLNNCPTTTTTTIPVTTTTTTFPFSPIPIQPKNECDQTTIFPLGVQCFTIDPTYSDSFDGVVGVGITGGTPPYTILWNTGSVAPAIFNVGVGEYKATVTDYYKDFTATTSCVLTAITTTTTTISPTTTQKTYGQFCLISTKTIGNIQQEQFYDLTYDGFYNGYPSWVSTPSGLFIYWSADTTNSWIVSGAPNVTILNTNYNEPTTGEPLPFNNWQVLGLQGTNNQLSVRIVLGPCSAVNYPSISVNKNDPACQCDGSISVLANGGTPPYQYSIDGGLSYQSTPVYQNLCAGGYTVFVKDTNDFVDSVFVTLVQQPIQSYTLSLVSTGSNSFSISISPSLPIGVSLTFTLTHSNSFTKQPASSPQVYNNVVTLIKNSITVLPTTGPVITTTNIPVLGPCSLFGKLKTDTITTWQNITLTTGDVITGTYTDTISTLAPLPECYSEPSKSRSLYITLNGATGCYASNISVVNPPNTGIGVIPNLLP